jgi:hypothetical protein
MDSDIRKAVTDAKVKGGDCSPSPVVIELGISSNSAGMSTLSVELCFLKQNKLYTYISGGSEFKSGPSLVRFFAGPVIACR